MDIKDFKQASESAAALFNEPEQTVVAEQDNTAADGKNNANNSTDADINGTDANTDNNAQNDTQPQQNSLENAVTTAEVAANLASGQAQQIAQMEQQINELTLRNGQLTNTIEQMSQQAQQSVVDQAVPPPAPPTIDFETLAFADEATRNETLAKYNNDLIDYQKSNIMKELDPFIKEAKRGAEAREKAELYSILEKKPQFAGISGMSDSIDNIIANNPKMFSGDMSLDEKVVAAYAMAKGVNAINNPVVVEPPKQPTAQELFEIYKSNPELQNLIEQSRIEQLKESQQVPQMAASTGVANAAQTIKERPKTMKEAGVAARKLLGL